MIKSAQLVSYALVLACSLIIAWSAWDRGGAYYSTQMKVALFLLAAGLLASLLLTRRVEGGSGKDKASRWQSLQPPLLVVLSMMIWACAILQTLPLPTSVAEFVAPGSSDMYANWVPAVLVQELLGSGSPPLGALAESAHEVKVSVATTYTRLALLGPVAFAAMCWVCFLSFRCLHSIFLFLFVIAGSGAAFSFFGLIDTVRLVRDWQVELRQLLTISPVGADDPFGPFVNNNNASGFLCLAIGCALGLWVLGEHLLTRAKKNGAENGRGVTSGLLIARIASAALIVTLVAGVIGSNSRGGFLGLLAGTLTVVAFLLPRFSKFKSAFVVCGVVFLSWLIISGLGFSERSQDRFETLMDKRILDDPRLDHWTDALVAAGHYLPFGSGLGTYRYACLPFQNNGAPLWFVNADGMQVEWLVEGGVWLLPLIAFAFGSLFRHVRRIGVSIRGVEQADLPPDVLAYANCVWVVALFAIPALLVTQCFDFGITLLPLLLTFAGICAAILRMSVTVAAYGLSGSIPSEVGANGLSVSSRSLLSRIIFSRGCVLARKASGPVLLMLLTLALALSAMELYVASIAQQQERWLRQERKQLLVDMPELTERMLRLEELALANPSNAIVWKALAELRLAEQQRLGAVQLFALQPVSVESHSRWVAPSTVRHATYNGGDGVLFPSRLLPKQNVDQWVQARQELIAALLLNPLDDRLRISLVELDMVALNANLASEDLLVQAARLRPLNDATLKYLIWLAQDYPGEEALAEIEEMRQRLRQKGVSP